MSTPERVVQRRFRAGGGSLKPEGGTRGSFEVYSWFFMRISGLILILLALYHVIWWNLVIGVEHLDSEIVIQRWNNPLWRFFNVMLISFAMLHGLNGLRYTLEDYIRNPGRQAVAKAVAYTLILSVFVFGVYALVTFNPAIFFAR